MENKTTRSLYELEMCGGFQYWTIISSLAQFWALAILFSKTICTVIHVTQNQKSQSDPSLSYKSVQNVLVISNNVSKWVWSSCVALCTNKEPTTRPKNPHADAKAQLSYDAKGWRKWWSGKSGSRWGSVAPCLVTISSEPQNSGLISSCAWWPHFPLSFPNKPFRSNH